MKKVNWPKVQVTKLEKLWLTMLYRMTMAGEQPTYKFISVALIKELPGNFHPSSIDARLALDNGERITLFGIYFINPKSDLIDKGNKIFNYIKNALIAEPERRSFIGDDMSKETGLPVLEIGFIIKLISHYGRFWSAAFGNDLHGYSNIDIGTDEVIFQQYIHFTCIEDLLNKYFQHDSDQSKKNAKYLLNQQSTEVDLTIESHKIRPIFKSQIESVDKRLCFVLMPFGEDWSERVYKSYIRENIEQLGFQCLRADELTGHTIIEDIWIKINQAAFIIADVTGRNANVMYELGIVHTVGKPAILITQDIANIPFDFTHLRHFAYKDNIDGLKQFTEQLKKIVPDIYRDNYPNTIIKMTPTKKKTSKK